MKGLKQLITSYIILIIFFFILDLFILEWSVIHTIIIISIYIAISFPISFFELKMVQKGYNTEKRKVPSLYIFGFGLLFVGIMLIVASIFAFRKFSEAPPPLVIVLILVSFVLGFILIWHAKTQSKKYKGKPRI